MAEHGSKRPCVVDCSLPPAAATASDSRGSDGVIDALPDMINIVLAGMVGCGKSFFVNKIINPAGKGETPVPSKRGGRGVSLAPMRFVKRRKPSNVFNVSVVPRDRSAAIRALQEAFFCATEADLQATIARVYGINSIDELLSQCKKRLLSNDQDVSTMKELTAVLDHFNTLCLSEDAKSSTRCFFANRVSEIQDRIAAIEEQRDRRVNKNGNFTKEAKAAMLAKLPGLKDDLKNAQANQADNNRLTERLPLGTIARWIEIYGDFAALPDNTAIIDSPGWGDTYGEMERDLFGAASVIITVSSRIGGDDDARVLAQAMRNNVLASPPGWSPVIVSLASSTDPDKMEDVKEMAYLLERWKTSVYHSIPEPTNPRLRALADRVFANADIMVNSDNFAAKLTELVQRARPQRQEPSEVQSPQLITPVFTIQPNIDLADLLRRRTVHLGSFCESNKKRTFSDGTANDLTVAVCIMQTMPEICARAWALFVDNLCDSVALAANEPGHKYALDRRATPVKVMKMIRNVLLMERAKFDKAVDADITRRLQSLFSYPTTAEAKKACYAECNTFIHAIVRSTLENVCSTHHFDVKIPAPQFDDQPITKFTHCGSFEQCKPQLTSDEFRNIQRMVHDVATQPLSIIITDDEVNNKPDVNLNKALMLHQALVLPRGVDLCKDLWNLLRSGNVGKDLLAGASGYDDNGNFRVDTYTGAFVTFIFLNSPEDIDKAMKTDRATKAADPALYDDYADRRVPRIHQHAQCRVFVDVVNKHWTIHELMAAICDEFGFPNWLHVPAGFCGLMEKLDGAAMRRQPVYDLQQAYRHMQLQFNTVYAVINDEIRSSASQYSTTTGFGGIGFLPASQYGLVSPAKKDSRTPFPIFSKFFC